MNSVVAAARSYIGTPFHHQGRLPGVGLDCAGVVVCAYREAGITIMDQSGYGRLPSKGLLVIAVEAHCDRIALSAVQDGDVLLFAFRAEPQHLAIYAGGNIIHAHAQAGTVLEQSLSGIWRDRLRGVFRMRT